MATIEMKNYSINLPEEPLTPYEWTKAVEMPQISYGSYSKEVRKSYEAYASRLTLGSFFILKLCPYCSHTYVAMDAEEPCPKCAEKKKIVPHIYFADAPLTMGLVRMITDALSAVFQSKHPHKVIYLEDLNLEGEPQ